MRIRRTTIEKRKKGEWTEFDEDEYKAKKEAREIVRKEAEGPGKKVTSQGKIVKIGSEEDDEPDEADKPASEESVGSDEDKASYAENQRKAFADAAATARAEGDERTRMANWAEACRWLIKYHEFIKQPIPET